ncbi:hypothetical protein [Streptomyces sp. NBC_01803]|uniref:hypothetical protein n=1 Tax=Streptomyces sp. NBC_01803 TaxID=2975946 RepID=UPI002DDA8C8B|nr:hypothetical protein [Streptomyces sp. NBC_01803]WSA46500.1 hypothetical protein OIE51_21335 [Streptomyces sp. NBC_01803]
MALNEPSDEPVDGEPLPCGRSLMEVWELWDEGLAGADPHIRSCPHCSAALEELRLLGDVVQQTRTAEPAEPETHAVTARVMDIVRLELRPGRTLPLGEPDEDTWVVEAAAARVCRAAAESVPGVRAGSCRVAPPAEGARRGPVRVRLEVVVDLSWTVPGLADAVRGRVAAAAWEDIGLEVGAIDIVVVDMIDAADEPHPRRRLR